MSKYSALRRQLERERGSSVEMTFDEIDHVVVGLPAWRTFRIEAISRGRSIADWLGELDEREVARIDETPRRVEASPVQSEDQSQAGAEVGEEQATDQRTQPRPRPQALDGQTLLTGLPPGVGGAAAAGGQRDAGSKPPPWEP